MMNDDADHVEHVATFRCHTCAAVAGSVMLIRGATGVWRAQHTGGYTIVVTDPLGHVTRWHPNASDTLRRALQSHDAPALFALDSDLTRLYCPTCDRWYCPTHQTIEERYEDDVPGGWYDATYATCPAGHRRLIDD